jgi:hypothetical protein
LLIIWHGCWSITTFFAIDVLSIASIIAYYLSHGPAQLSNVSMLSFIYLVRVAAIRRGQGTSFVVVVAFDVAARVKITRQLRLCESDHKNDQN